MRLVELNPQFVRLDYQTPYVGRSWSFVDKIEDADGVSFKCPKCVTVNNGDQKGVHSIMCLRPRVPGDITPGPGRWEFTGNGYDDLTLTAASSSILLSSGCRAHFFIENGVVRDA